MSSCPAGILIKPDEPRWNRLPRILSEKRTSMSRKPAQTIAFGHGPIGSSRLGQSLPADNLFRQWCECTSAWGPKCLISQAPAARSGLSTTCTWRRILHAQLPCSNVSRWDRCRYKTDGPQDEMSPRRTCMASVLVQEGSKLPMRLTLLRHNRVVRRAASLPCQLGKPDIPAGD